MKMLNGNHRRLAPVLVLVLLVFGPRGVAYGQGSTDATLKELTVGPVDIVDFDSAVTGYHIGVTYSVTQITITATATDAGATIQIGKSRTDVSTVASGSGHVVPLAVGRNSVGILVTSSDGNTSENDTIVVGRGVESAFGWNAADDFNTLYAAGNQSPGGIWSNGSTMWVVAGAKIYSFNMPFGTVTYDSDGDGLIEIGSLAQLNAVRWDLDGDGAVDDNANAAAYAHAFPNAVAGMGCPTTADDADDNDCIGYELTADLDFDTNGDGTVDASDSYWNGRAGWLPIGSSGSGNEFVATFEGNGHTIDNLYINRSASTVGLFGVVGADGHVRNVGVREVTVGGYGRDSVIGGLVGINRGEIVGSYATGFVGGPENGATVGGLVGANTGSIASSFATNSVKGFNADNVGGLVGLHGTGDSRARAIITRSYATGHVSYSTDPDVGGPVGDGDYANVGGLVGSIGVIGSGTRGMITASYATGALTSDGGSNNVGGLVGRIAALGIDCKAIITASYATGAVSGYEGSNRAGGLVGYNLSGGTDSGGIITASYATGEVTDSGPGNVGGLVGKDSTNLNSINTVGYSYWNTETSGQATSDGGAGKTTIELVTPTGYAGIYATWNLDLDDDNTKDDPWEFGNTNEYPMLRADFDGDGDVDADDVNPQRRVASSPAVSTDFNGDGRTDFQDFFLFADAFGSSDTRYDLNGDGSVDFADFFRFVDAFGT